MAPGVAERRTHTYLRNGTTSLFAALDVATGAVVGKCYKRHPLPGSAFARQMSREGAKEFLDFLKELDRNLPEGPDVHLVMDNYATHKTPKVKTWLARRPHWHVHFTPTSASWLNPPLGRFAVQIACRSMDRTLVR